MKDLESVPVRSPSRLESLDTDSREWIRSLNSDGDERTRAIVRLHDLLLRAARHEAHRRKHFSPVGGVELDDICQQAADDALLAVINKLDSYRGASRFTTWAYKFVVLETAVKLRRHAWRGRTIPAAADDPIWDRPTTAAEGADARVEAVDLARALRLALADLTPHQRDVFVAVVLNGVPGDVMAERLGSARGAIYKTVHDARRNLRRRLETQGYLTPVVQR